jgi:hypothetical protein
MEMELMELGILKNDMEELETIAEKTGFYALRAETIAWHNTLIIDGEVMF